MEAGYSTDISQAEPSTDGFRSLKNAWFGHHYFQNEDLIRISDKTDTVDPKTLTNIINHIHFMDQFVLVLLHQCGQKSPILLRARPEPYGECAFICRWAENHLENSEFEKLRFECLIIDDGESAILVRASLVDINKKHLVIQINEAGHIAGKRQIKRHTAKAISVQLTQSGFSTKGDLADFSPFGFCIRLNGEPSGSFDRFDWSKPITVNLFKDQRIFYSGICRYVRQLEKPLFREIVLTPVDRKYKRFPKKHFRNFRQELVPAPVLEFDHPFMDRYIQLETSDSSTGGFAVYEDAHERVLLPGMVIPQLKIAFPGGMQLECDAQVIYCIMGENKKIRSGIAVLDMNIDTYNRLANILVNAKDPHARIPGKLDLAALWEFFFATGFIYPRKYGLIRGHREAFKKTYQTLYQENPEIAVPFTYQKNGRIYGHMSMVKGYERSWMIHHHAARAKGDKKAGVVVLKQIMHYSNGIYRLPSAKMDYVFCYYRPENKFPDRVFGGVAKSLNNASVCSMDLFSYRLYATTSEESQLPSGWSLEESTRSHFQQLRRFYSQNSGGLLLDMLNLEQSQSSAEITQRLYRQAGLQRKWKFYSLTQNGRSKAVFLVNQTDLGLNLSELLNGIKAIIIDPGNLPTAIFTKAIQNLASIYPTEKIPALIYPSNYLDASDGDGEAKKYMLWIYDARDADPFFEYLERKFRIRHWK